MKINELIKNGSIYRIGRTYIADEALHMNFSGSGVRVAFKGEKIKVTFKSKRYDEENNKPHICIVVDDNKYYYLLDQEYTTIELALANQDHIVDILKNSESPVSQTAIVDIDVEELNIYNHPKKTKIEFYGDSITCGFGSLSQNADDIFTSKTESFVDGYAYHCSNILDCDYSVVAVSGFPVYKSRWNLGFPIDSVADMISICDYLESMKMVDTISWDNKNYTPDIVVINLGTNDESYFTPGTPWIDELISVEGSYEKVQELPIYKEEIEKFKNRLIKFLDDLFEVYGDIKIVYATGILPIMDGINNVINQTIEEYKLKHNRKVYRYEFKVRKHFDQRGAANHPGKAMQKFAGAELADFIFDLI